MSGGAAPKKRQTQIDLIAHQFLGEGQALGIAKKVVADPGLPKRGGSIKKRYRWADKYPRTEQHRQSEREGKIYL